MKTNRTAKISSTRSDWGIKLFCYVGLPIFIFLGIYYNGRDLDLRCTIDRMSQDEKVRCSYQVSFLGIPIQSGENEWLQKTGSGRHSLHLYFENDSVSLGYAGKAPGTENPGQPFQLQYRPFSIWILWVVVFLPSFAALVFIAIYLPKQTRLPD